MEHHINHYLKKAHIIGVKDLVGYVDSPEGKIALTIGEPDFDTDPKIKEAAVAALWRNETHYPPVLGYEEVRQAIIDFEAKNHHVHYELDEVCVTQGSTEGIASVLFTLLNPGDEVIVPIPAYPLYTSVIEMAGAKVVGLNIADNNFEIDPLKLESLISDKTKVLILTTPNNPTGTVFSKQNLEEVCDVLSKHDIYVIVDEIYSQILYTEYFSFARFAEIRDRIIVVQSFSKIYAMTGWRLGYILAEKTLLDEILKWHHNIMVGVTSFIQFAIIEALKLDVSDIVASYRKRRDYTYKRLVDMGLDVQCPDGAFYIFPSVKEFGMTSREFCIDVANKADLMLVPGDCFGDDDHVRISFCYSLEILEEGLNRLADYISQIK